MPAPTSVRVEATSPTTTQLRWANAESNPPRVHRSTDGVNFSQIVILATGTITYQDTNLSSGVQYYYKLSYDGVTFSLVVTVVTHVCPSPQGNLSGFVLPTFGGAEQQSDELNNMARRIEETLIGRVLSPGECPVCPTNGAIVIDCTTGCDTFVVLVDQDINSISIISCDHGQGTIEFVVPSGTRQICGWPSGFSFSGDECFNSAIVGPRSANVGFKQGKLKPSFSRPGYGGGGGGLGGACACTPGLGGQLTLQCCSTNCSLSCTGSKKLTLKACGGRSPYTWSKTGSVVLSRTTGNSVEVTPPVNNGGGVAGVAYSFVIACTGLGTTVFAAQDHNCDDSTLGGCPQVCFITPCAVCPAWLQTCFPGCVGPFYCGSIPGSSPTENCAPTEPTGACSQQCSPGSMCDRRTAQMITDGCNPCALSTGQTITVTDSLGVSVSRVLSA